MSRRLAIAFAIGVMGLLPSSAWAVDVVGNLTTDTVWSSGVTYRMTGPVTVPAGITLTIEPGALVYSSASSSSYLLTVQGSLKVGVYAASGDADATKPVLFCGYQSSQTSTTQCGTNTTRGTWGGIVFDTNSSGHVFKNVDLRGAVTGLKTLATAGLTVEDTIVRDCSQYGLYVQGTAATLTFRGSGPTANGPLSTARVYNSGYRGIYNEGALTVTQAEVSYSGYDGIYSQGNSQITGCNIHHNGGTSYYYGVNFQGALAAGSQTLSRNVIWQNGLGGVYVYTSGNGQTYLIEHNTFDNNDRYSSTTYEMNLAPQYGTNTVTVRDNIATNNKNYGISGNSWVTAHHNLVWNNGTSSSYNYSGVSPGAGAASCNPLYVATDGSNYRITSNSPAVGADSSTPARDIGALPYTGDSTPGLQGILRDSLTLTAANSPYQLLGDLVVPAGVTLTIEPGVSVVPAASDNMKCNADAAKVEILVDGTLSAAGTSSAAISFVPSSTTRGTWGGISLSDASSGHALSYVDIAYGTNCLTTNASQLTLSNAKVRSCSGDGITVGQTSSTLTVTGTQATSVVSDCGGWGFRNAGALTVINSSILRNSYGGVYSNGNSQLTGNEIANNGSSNSSAGYGVTFDNALPNGNQTMSRNTVHHNYAGGLSMTISVAGIVDLIEHNTFDTNDLYSSTSYEIYASTSAGTSTIRDNILTNNDNYGLYRSYSTGLTVSNNLTNGNPSGDYYPSTSTGNGAVFCNPLYVATDGTNYRLTQFSPARLADSGTPQRDIGALPYLGDTYATPTLMGILPEDTVLTAAGSPWAIPGDLIVPAGVTLTIEPGATLVPATTDGMKCGSNASEVELVVRGSLVVNGTPANRAYIKPTTLTAGQWEGLRFEASSTGNTISGLDVGYGTNCVDVKAPGVTLTNTKIHDCSNNAVTVAAAPASLTITGDAGKHGGAFLYESVVATASGYGIYADGELTLTNTEVSGGYYANVQTNGKATIVGNRIRNSGYGYGISTSVPASTANLIQNNVVHNNYKGGIYLYTPQTSGTVNVDHNTVANNSSYGLYLYGSTYSPSPMTVRNNIIVSNGSYGMYRYSGVMPSPSYNDVWGHSTNYSSYIYAGTGSLSVDPLFNYATGKDYRLMPTSPARNADNGTPRADMGALPYYAIQVDNVAVSPATPDVKAAGTQTFTAQAYEGWSSFPVGGLSYSWSVVNGGGTINAGGTLTAGCTLGNFAGTVQASAGGVNGTTAINVVPGDAASATVSPATASLKISQQTTFSATTKDACGNVTTEGVNWSVTNASAGIVDSTGVFTANTNAGTYVDLIKATSKVTGVVGYATVTISAGNVAVINVAPKTASVNAGATGRFTATALDSYANPVTFAPVWSMAPTCTLGTIDAATGIFTADTTNGTCTNGIVATDAVSGVKGYATINVTSNPLASISVAPANPSTPVKGTLQFTASGKDSANGTVALTPTWSVSGGGSIDQNGLFTAGCTTGSYTVTATQGTVSGSTTITVNAGAVASVTVAPASTDVAVAATRTFAATARDSCGNAVTITPVWAVVSGGGTINASTGVFTAGMVLGTYANTVKATAAGVEGFASVNVTAGALDSITVVPNTASLTINATQQFTAIGKDAYGNTVTFTPTWSVAAGGGTIDQTGLFTAGGTAGTYTNTVKATSGTKFGTASVTVNPGPLATIALTPANPTLTVNGTQQFTAQGKDAGGNNVPTTLSWSVVNGGGTITSTGLFTAGTTSGNYANTVKVTDDTTSIFATTSVTINPGALATVTVTPATASVTVGQKQTYTAAGADTYGNAVTITPTWSLVSCTLGTISGGQFTAGSTPGTCTNGIKATSGTISGTASVTIVAGALASLTIAPATATLNPNGTQTFSATGKDSYGNVVPATVTWSVTNASAGTIDASTGAFTAGTTAGTYTGTVKATSGTITGTATVVVNPGALSTLTLSPTTATLAAGATQQFTATGKDTYGNTVTFTPSWQVVNGGGTINATGLFTAGNITGTYTDTVRVTSGSLSATASVTVTAGALSRIVLTPATTTLSVGGTQQFTARGEDSAGNVVSITPTWSLTSATAGTINASGLFTAGNTAGTFTGVVKATSGTVSGTATVTVNPGPLASISVAPTNLTIGPGGTQQFTATGRDTHGNTVPVSPTWSIADPNAGSISAAGLFTAGAVAGSYPNSVVATQGSISGSASVTIQAGALAQIVLAPTSIALAPNGTQQFTATGKDASGNTVPVSITWSVVNGGGSITSSGLFTAGSTAGTYANTVKAASGTLSAFATVTISTGGLATITITPATVTLAAGSTQQFTATGKDVFGNTLPITPTWTAANGGTIDATGLFTAGCNVGNFVGAVTATVGTVSGQASVTVTAGPLVSMAVSPANVTTATGSTQQFTATGKDACNNSVSVTPTWTVTNALAGSITAAGLFTASANAGDYPGAVKAEQGTVSATASVKLVAGTIARVVLTPATVTLSPQATQSFIATAYDSGNNPVSSSFTWAVVNGGGTINSAGLFTAGTKAGNYPNTVQATASNGVTGFATLTVQPGPLANIAITPASGKTSVLGTISFTAAPKDAFGNAVPVSIAWSVSAGGGSIDQNGVFTAGTVASTFTNTVNAKSGTVTGRATVEVTPGPVASVAVTPSSASIVVKGQQVFTATARDAYGNVVNAPAAWSVVAGGGTINATTGVFTAGTTAGSFANTVRATVASVNGHASVSVQPGALSQITMAPKTVSLRTRATQQFQATGVDAFGNAVTFTPSWRVLNPAAGTITAGGLFTAGSKAGVFPGTVVASFGAVSDVADVTVLAGALARVVVTPPSVTLFPGDTQQFSAEGRDADDNLVPIAPGWSMSGASVGTLTATGLFTAGTTLGDYPAAIRASFGTMTGTASVKVAPPAIVRVAISPETPTLPMGREVTFAANAFDARDQKIEGLPVTWEVINGGGAITPAGVFTASMEPGKYTQTVKATVSGTVGITDVTIATDFDTDGMPDPWELTQGLDHTNAADAAGDLDRDALTNVDEYRAGADPRDPDSDDDGVLDGNEVKPTEDSDADGRSNTMDPDSDNDGLPDGLEMAVTTPSASTDTTKGNFVADMDSSTSTDPSNEDTDGDGMRDGDEDVNRNGVLDDGETDPNVADRLCSSNSDCNGGTCVGGVCKGGNPDGGPGPTSPCDPACGAGQVCNEQTKQCVATGMVEQSGCGCTSAGGTAPLLGGLAMLLFGALRRRSPRRK